MQMNRSPLTGCSGGAQTTLHPARAGRLGAAPSTSAPSRLPGPELCLFKRLFFLWQNTRNSYHSGPTQGAPGHRGDSRCAAIVTTKCPGHAAGVAAGSHGTGVLLGALPGSWRRARRGGSQVSVKGRPAPKGKAGVWAPPPSDRLGTRLMNERRLPGQPRATAATLSAGHAGPLSLDTTSSSPPSPGPGAGGRTP